MEELKRAERIENLNRLCLEDCGCGLEEMFEFLDKLQEEGFSQQPFWLKDTFCMSLDGLNLAVWGLWLWERLHDDST